MSIIDEMEREWRRKIASLRRDIERLEAGEFRFGEKRFSAEHGWRDIDTTQEAIARDKALITEYEWVLALRGGPTLS